MMKTYKEMLKEARKKISKDVTQVKRLEIP